MQPSIGFVPEGFIEMFGIANPNYLLNAEFKINQRQGTTYDSQTLGTTTAANFYTFDRWKWSASSAAGTGAVARVQITRELFTADQIEVEGSPYYFLRITNLTNSAIASDRQHSLKQHIEYVHRVANKNITISFWARSSISGKKLGVILNPVQSTNGSRPANSYSAPNQEFTLTTTWQKYSATLKPTLLSGFVIGTSDNDNMEFSFVLDYLPPSGGTTFVGAWGGTGTVDIAQPQIENGVEPTDFMMRLVTTDLMLCQRYFWQNNGGLVSPGFNDLYARIVVPFVLPFPMRATPTVTSTSMSFYDVDSVKIKTFKTVSLFGNQTMVIEYNNPSVTGNYPVHLYSGGGQILTASAEY